MKQGLVRLLYNLGKVHGVDITHDNVCSSILSCFYSHLLSTGRPISSISSTFNNSLGRGLEGTFILGYQNYFHCYHLDATMTLIIVSTGRIRWILWFSVRYAATAT